MTNPLRAITDILDPTGQLHTVMTNTDRVNKAITVLEQAIYRHNTNYPGVNPHSIPVQHTIYLTNKGMGAVLTQWVNQGCPREFEESMLTLADAISGLTS